MRNRLSLIAVLCLLIAPVAILAQSVPLAITGTLVTPQEIVPNGTILIQNGKILAAGAQVQIPQGATVVHTDGVIAPGLIDLHNHLTWNVFPRWKPNQEFGNRYDWQQKPVYNLLMSEPHYELVSDGLECEMERYAEVKAITEGETSVVGGMYAACDQGLARNLDYDAELGSKWGEIIYNVFPLTMSESDVAQAIAALNAKPRGSLLIHIAEGSPHDASAAREFSEFEGRGLLKPGVSIIHGVALTPQNFASMAKAGVGFIWSPRSNIELYGDTANVAAAKVANVVMALAPDWSPTGSDGLLGELNYASVWNGSQNPPPFTDRDLVMMATSNAAALVGLQDSIGSLTPGHAADLIVIRDTGKAHNKDAYWSLTHATPEDVDMVMIGGIATYGNPQLMRQISDSPVETLRVCGSDKNISFASEKQKQESFAETELTLGHALLEMGRKLAPLSECGN
ncbi:amidohydrolase family protein [Alloacidobacterium sp.]|uniref:amidohydrolase family protein n=1 Tax=Alloacidobacterium sp. TaxID=2951999 RepID=UPI002D754397|nr:amidohydrolase family protein [Alloacidobacterium sp.]HYK37662.1 amidohydrolase family protein [Alloacidobacterium sp.]